MALVVKRNDLASASSREPGSCVGWQADLESFAGTPPIVPTDSKYEKAKAYNHAYYAANKDKVRAQRRAYINRRRNRPAIAAGPVVSLDRTIH